MNNSVYVHIPFCTSICSYCDFCKMKYNDDFAIGYLMALEQEIIEKYNHENIKTLYIGGGTPSALKIPDLKKLFNSLKLIKLGDEYEFTFECNIDDVREELLSVLKDNKVNRLSIGIQSFNKNNLEFLGRDANFNDTFDKIKLCRKYGFNNINVDLMYAIPGESIRTLKKDIKKILKLKVEHISTYSLIIENNTMLKINNVEYISDIKDEKMYRVIRKFLKKNKYNHYEVSNFSKEGFESKHNSVYWNNEEYYGFGLGAAGYYEGVRYENTKSLTDYISKEFTKEKNILSKKENMDYELMLGFRKMDGINVLNFKEKFNEDIFEVYEIEKQINEKNLIFKNNNIFINPKKIYVMNEILIKLI